MKGIKGYSLIKEGAVPPSPGSGFNAAQSQSVWNSSSTAQGMQCQFDSFSPQPECPLL